MAEEVIPKKLAVLHLSKCQQFLEQGSNNDTQLRWETTCDKIVETYLLCSEVAFNQAEEQL